MNSLLRWFRRRRELSQISGRRRELEAELSAHFGGPVRLTPASAKGGYDEIFHATRDGSRFAVVRVNSPFKRPSNFTGPRGPVVVLAPEARLAREWEAYERLFPAGLAPKPLWRTHDAIACARIEWARASILLKRHRESFWSLFERAVAAIGKMHDLGVVHLDLNWGNLLAPDSGPGLAVIDFEVGPVDWISREQQMAYDYLRLIDDSIRPRRGGKLLLADLARMEQALMRTVPEPVREVKLAFVFDRLVRLAEQTAVRDRLRSLFVNLDK